MAEKKTYMVRLPDKRVGRTNNLSVAKSLIDRAGGGRIYSLPFVPWGSMAMDFPTFASTGDLVPYTAGKKRRVDRGSSSVRIHRVKQNPTKRTGLKAIPRPRDPATLRLKGWHESPYSDNRYPHIASRARQLRAQGYKVLITKEPAVFGRLPNWYVIWTFREVVPEGPMVGSWEPTSSERGPRRE